MTELRKVNAGYAMGEAGGNRSVHNGEPAGRQKIEGTKREMYGGLDKTEGGCGYDG